MDTSSIQLAIASSLVSSPYIRTKDEVQVEFNGEEPAEVSHALGQLYRDQTIGKQGEYYYLRSRSEEALAAFAELEAADVSDGVEHEPAKPARLMIPGSGLSNLVAAKVKDSEVVTPPPIVVPSANMHRFAVSGKIAYLIYSAKGWVSRYNVASCLGQHVDTVTLSLKRLSTGDRAVMEGHGDLYKWKNPDQYPFEGLRSSDKIPYSATVVAYTSVDMYSQVVKPPRPPMKYKTKKRTVAEVLASKPLPPKGVLQPLYEGTQGNPTVANVPTKDTLPVFNLAAEGNRTVHLPVMKDGDKVDLDFKGATDIKATLDTGNPDSTTCVTVTVQTKEEVFKVRPMFKATLDSEGNLNLVQGFSNVTLTKENVREMFNLLKGFDCI